jgi:hypothetical protein
VPPRADFSDARIQELLKALWYDIDSGPLDVEQILKGLRTALVDVGQQGLCTVLATAITDLLGALIYCTASFKPPFKPKIGCDSGSDDWVLVVCSVQQDSSTAVCITPSPWPCQELVSTLYMPQIWLLGIFAALLAVREIVVASGVGRRQRILAWSTMHWLPSSDAQSTCMMYLSIAVLQHLERNQIPPRPVPTKLPAQ